MKIARYPISENITTMMQRPPHSENIVGPFQRVVWLQGRHNFCGEATVDAKLYNRSSTPTTDRVLVWVTCTPSLYCILSNAMNWKCIIGFHCCHTIEGDRYQEIRGTGKANLKTRWKVSLYSFHLNQRWRLPSKVASHPTAQAVYIASEKNHIVLVLKLRQRFTNVADMQHPTPRKHGLIQRQLSNAV